MAAVLMGGVAGCGDKGKDKKTGTGTGTKTGTLAPRNDRSRPAAPAAAGLSFFLGRPNPRRSRIMTRWALRLLALAALALAGCGSEHERGKNTKGDRPKRGDKS